MKQVAKLIIIIYSCIVFTSFFSTAQNFISLNDLNSFKSQAGNWKIVGDVNADLDKKDVFLTNNGTGVLINQPTQSQKDELFTIEEYNDIDIEFDFMMAKGANSGVYLQSRYEIQLLDSWGKTNPAYYDCGGIYQRWDESKKGQEGYEGYAPRTNACLAPGLWQHIKIAFQAPQFDANGKKIANAKMLKIELNGIIIHENVELTGVTRGAVSNTEVEKAPIRIQGDHGAVAFKNMNIKSYGKETAALSNINYAVYNWDKGGFPDLGTLTPYKKGETKEFTHEITDKPNEYAVKYTGKITVPSEGMYHFDLAHRGSGALKIDNQQVTKMAWWENKGSIRLLKGEHTFEYLYGKRDGWLQSGLGMTISGETLRAQPLHTLSSMPLSNPTNPIYISTASQTEVMRCFIDFEKNKYKTRIVHAGSVNSPTNLHYTMDFDNGALVQIWKGNFLDATPMWDNRGDGSCRPMGLLTKFDNFAPIQVLNSINAPCVDTLSKDMGFRFRGYDLDEKGNPTFKYDILAMKVEDKPQADADGKMLNRTITFSGSTLSNVFYRIATSDNIEKLSNNIYAIDNKRYFIKIANNQAFLRKSGERQDLLIPINNGATIQYSIFY